MVKTSSSRFPEGRSLWEPYTFKNCMFAPATTNLCNISNLGLNGSGFSGFPRGDLAYEGNDTIRKPAFCSWIPPVTPSECFPGQNSLFQPRVDVLASTDGAPSTPQKKFLIFDQSGDGMRLIRSTSLFPRNAAQTRCSSPESQLVEEDQPSKRELVGNEKYGTPEESGETETVDEGSEMREDTEEINALLYSDDEDFDDESEGDNEVSTGHSPLVNQEHDFDEVASFERSTKRQKTLDGGHNIPPILSATTLKDGNPSNKTIDGGESVCSSNEGSSPTAGNKRVRKDKIRDTLRVLERIVPGLKSKDPVTILDEAINYLESLKPHAKTMSMEDPDGSSCYGPSN